MTITITNVSTESLDGSYISRWPLESVEVSKATLNLMLDRRV